jgi:hypothetical protein
MESIDEEIEMAQAEDAKIFANTPLANIDRYSLPARSTFNLQAR